MNLNFHDIVIQEACNLNSPLNKNRKYLKYPTNLKISYHSNLSEINFIKPKVNFDETGFFDLGIVWSGEMVKRRMGDVLPYEYKINNNR